MDTFADRPRRISLADVAQAAGVGKATACRALLGRTRVAETTRQRVQAAADRLGYRPDPTLSALTKHRWGIGDARRATYHVAFVGVRGADATIPKARESGLQSSNRSAAERCRELGLLFSEWLLEEHPNPDSLGRILHHRGVDAVIFHIGGPVADLDFPWQHFAVASVGIHQGPHRTHSVAADWFSSVLLAAAKAREARARRIGFARFRHRNREIDDRLAAAVEYCRESHAAAYGPQPTVFTYPETDEHIRQCGEREERRFWKWFRSERPDVIIDTNRIGYWWLRDRGVAMPRDVGYATTYGPGSTEGESGISGVSLRPEAQARSAVEMVFNLLQLNQRGLPGLPLRVVVPCAWMAGNTLAAPGL